MKTKTLIFAIAFPGLAIAQAPRAEMAGMSATRTTEKAEADAAAAERSASAYRTALDLLSSGYAQASIDQLEQVLVADPRDAHALLVRADAFAVLGQIDRADDDLWRVLGIRATGPAAERALLRLGQHAYDEGDISTAQILFDRYVQIAPYDAKAWCHRGMAYTALRNDEAALEDLEHALDLDPQLDKAHVYKGIILLRMGFRQEGCASLQMAHELGDLSTEEMLLIHCDR